MSAVDFGTCTECGLPYPVMSRGTMCLPCWGKATHGAKWKPRSALKGYMALQRLAAGMREAVPSSAEVDRLERELSRERRRGERKDILASSLREEIERLERELMREKRRGDRKETLIAFLQNKLRTHGDGDIVRKLLQLAKNSKFQRLIHPDKHHGTPQEPLATELSAMFNAAS